MANARSTTSPMASTMVVSRTRKPQKMNACMSPGQQPLEELALPQDHGGLRARRALGDVVEPVDRLAQSDQAEERASAGGEQRDRNGEQHRQHGCADDPPRGDGEQPG